MKAIAEQTSAQLMLGVRAHEIAELRAEVESARAGESAALEEVAR